jgi:hypothetical protein
VELQPTVHVDGGVIGVLFATSSAAQSATWSPKCDWSTRKLWFVWRVCCWPVQTSSPSTGGNPPLPIRLQITKALEEAKLEEERAAAKRAAQREQVKKVLEDNAAELVCVRARVRVGLTAPV